MESNQDIDRDEIRLYLLGDLEDERRVQLEESLFSHPDLQDEIVAAEDDLIDDYLTETLNDQERLHFENHFSITVERQNKIQFARNFRRYLDSRQLLIPQEELGEGVTASPVPGFLSRHRLSLAFIAAVFFLALLCGGLLAYKRNALSQSRPTIAFSLRPVAVRSLDNNTQEIIKPPADAVVGFRLQLGRSTYRKYRAELLREAEHLIVFEDLQAKPIDNYFAVDVKVDASLLENEEGDYLFKLSGVSETGQVVPAEEYGFRVNR